MDKSAARIIVVDDEKYICSIIQEALATDDMSALTFSDPEEAFEHIENNHIDLVLTDLVMGNHSGVEILERTLQHHPDAIVILMTAHPTVQTAISVLKKGGYDFLVKPFKLEVLKATIRRGLAHQKILRENLQLKSQVEFLKVASAYNAEVGIDTYLQMVLDSCRTELGAVAAGVIEIDPVSGDVIRKMAGPKEGEHTDEILDESRLLKFAYTKSDTPYIKTKRFLDKGRQMSRILVAKPIFVQNKLHGMITLLIIDRMEQITPGKLDVLTILTNSAASAIANNRLYEDLQKSYLEAISGLAHAIEARDECTKGHTDRVVRLAQLVARELGWSDAEMDTLEMGCTLHDVGKLGVPDSILNKPDRLDDTEQERMRSHPEVGMRIVGGIELFKPAIPYVIAHHERYDGNGYPKGLKGEEIPIEGRLLAVVDTLDAILSDRPYRKGAPLRQALAELWENRGTQFDPQIVDILFRLIREGRVDFNALYEREEDISCVDEITTSEKAPV